MSSKLDSVRRADLSGPPSQPGLRGPAYIIAVALLLSSPVTAQRLDSWRATETPRFYADDPLWQDPDMRTIAPVEMFDLSKSYEFLHETFGHSAQSRGPALNVNTL